ncbi:hypothetical protein FACS1894132_05910 [Clostridia bacterium]|nr:hypothetical protein FACS1894132_05910 [Clostridia bacterium]
MIKIAIVDDEKILRKKLTSMLLTFDFSQKDTAISEISSGEEFIEYYANNSADIIFFNIEMDEINGLKTAAEIREVDKDVIIIFLTNFKDFVFSGYEVKAFRHLLKTQVFGDGDNNELKEITEKALTEYQQQHKTITLSTRTNSLKSL